MSTKIFTPPLYCNESDNGGDNGDGVNTFIELEDTPEAYQGNADKVVKVNATEDGLIFTESEGEKGDPGEPGPPGADGLPGADGQDGVDGQDGQDGQDGANGQDGVDGADGIDGLNSFQGVGDPDSSLGVDGDTYLDSSDGDLYKKVNGVWVLTGNLTGPPGSGDGGGVDNFTELLDTPNNYVGASGKFLKVSEDESHLIYTDAPEGGGTGNGNIYQIPVDTVYEVEAGQELINTGLFYIDGEMHLDGKWALLGETVPLTAARGGEVGFGNGDDDHTHSELIVLADLNMSFVDGHYEQDVYHTLGSFPLLKLLDQYGTVIDPIIKHISLGHFVIESNIALSGKVYALHSVQTRTPVLFGPLELQAYGDDFFQIIDHFADGFPFFIIMDGEGEQIELEINHMSAFRTEIKSNILVTGNIYML